MDIVGHDAAILGGAITLAWVGRSLGSAREAVSDLAFGIASRRVEIATAGLGDDAGLIEAVPLDASALPQRSADAS